MIAALAFLFPSMLWSAAHAAPDFSGLRPEGRFEFQGHYDVPQVRIVESVALNTPGAEQRLAQLRREGFVCIKKSPTAFRCTQMARPSELPPGLDETLQQKMKGVFAQFAGPFTEPELVSDTGQGREWLFHEEVLMKGGKAALFRLTEYFDGHSPAVTFPVSEETPLSFADFPSANELVLHAVVNARQDERTLGYLIEIRLERL